MNVNEFCGPSNLCAYNPCQNDGVCIRIQQNNDDLFRCLCLPGPFTIHCVFLISPKSSAGSSWTGNIAASHRWIDRWWIDLLFDDHGTVNEIMPEWILYWLLLVKKTKMVRRGFKLLGDLKLCLAGNWCPRLEWIFLSGHKHSISFLPCFLPCFLPASFNVSEIDLNQ